MPYSKRHHHERVRNHDRCHELEARDVDFATKHHQSEEFEMSAQSPEVVREFLIDGLRDAHAMESQAISLTSAQVDRLEHYSDLETRIREYLRETEGQRERLERCLERLGTSASTLKDAALKVGANLAAMMHSMADDEVIKNSLASFAFENFEIISYKALIETARLAGDADIEEVCRRNLAEEERMAAWIEENLPELIHKYLARSSADVEAKR
jgi:ferritin-like metal-binding protein YciE